MRYRSGLIGTAALAAVSAALSAEAAEGREPWAKVGEWEVSPLRAGHCTADRDYPGGTQVSVSSLQDGAVGLSVTNRDWLRRTEILYTLRLVQNGVPRSFAGGAKPEFRTLNLVARSSGASLLAQLAGGGSLEVVGPGGRLIERLELSGIAPALARLAPCLAHATLENYPPAAPPPPPPPPPPPRAIGAQPPRPRISPHLLFSNADYPPSAFRAGEQGIVGFRADVGEDGRVTGCAITRSSGSAALDSATCRVIRTRSRFQPAQDRHGKPSKGSFEGRIAWRLPEPDPPPP